MKDKKITLRELREESGKSIADVAEALYVNKNAISNYERGIRRINIEQVLILAELFQVSAEIVILAQMNSKEIFNAE